MTHLCFISFSMRRPPTCGLAYGARIVSCHRRISNQKYGHGTESNRASRSQPHPRMRGTSCVVANIQNPKGIIRLHAHWRKVQDSNLRGCNTHGLANRCNNHYANLPYSARICHARCRRLCYQRMAITIASGNILYLVVVQTLHQQIPQKASLGVLATLTRRYAITHRVGEEEVGFEPTGLTPCSFQDYRTKPLCDSSKSAHTCHARIWRSCYQRLVSHVADMNTFLRKSTEGRTNKRRRMR